MHAGRLGEVARIALLGRHRDDLAAIFEHGPVAAGRDCEVADVLRIACEAGPRLGQVGGHADLEPVRLPLVRVEDVDPAGLLVDQLSGAGRGAGDREGIVIGASGDGFRAAIVRIEVELAVAVGEKVDRLADPHRLGVVAAPGGLGDLLVRKVIELEDPDPRRRSAAVVLPLAEDLAERGVGQEFPVGRDRPFLAGRDRQTLGHAALGRPRRTANAGARKPTAAS